MGTLPAFDLTLPETYAAGTPHEIFALLRRLEPVYFHARAGGEPGFWCLTKYTDIAAVGCDPKRFTSVRGTGLHPSRQADAMADRAMTSMDPPRHTRIRGAIQQAFSPKRMKLAESVVRHYADRAINEVIAPGETDLFSVAAMLPISMISRLMGLPEEKYPQILEWTNKTFGADEYVSDTAETMDAYREIMAYGLEVAVQRRSSPGDDLVSALVTAQIDGEPLTDEEIAWNFFLLMGAGNDTTRTLILNAMNVLLDHPEAWAELRTKPELLRNAIEEVLRMEPSVRGMGRTATEDVVIRDCAVQKGDHVYMWYSSGNRDEEIFLDPDRFDIHRPNASRHQSFGGGGPHFCAGSSLARLQTRILFEQILIRMPDVERARPATRAQSTGFMNSIKNLPIRFTPGVAIEPTAIA